MDNIRAQYASSTGGRTIVGRILRGDDLISGIEKICHDNEILYGTVVSAIGSLSSIRYIYVRPDKEAEVGIRYTEPVEIEGAVELLSGQGMVGLTDEGEMSVHFHGIMVNTDQKLIGGHLIKGGNIVLATIEITILELKGLELKRRFDQETKFPLFNFMQIGN